MVTHKVRKHLKGFIARCHFDGRSGVPRCTSYLNWESGCWENKICAACIFPTREIANGFMNLRLRSEKRWGELSHIANSLVISGIELMPHTADACPTLAASMMRRKETAHPLARKRRGSLQTI